MSRYRNIKIIESDMESKTPATEILK